MVTLQNITAFFNRDRIIWLVCVTFGIAVSIAFRTLASRVFSPYKLMGTLCQMLYFISAVITVYWAVKNRLEKWRINSKLSLVYLLIPGICYHVYLMLDRHFRLSPFTWTHIIFAGIVIPFTLYYIFESVRNKRPLFKTLAMVSVILFVLIRKFHYFQILPDEVTWSLWGILILFGLYLILSVLVTLLFTGSFGVTIRYWEWLLTEPPKRVIRFLFKINRDKVICRHCERIIPLVGTYTCSKCKFTFKGHYFDWCPYCYSRFGYIDCECSLSRKRPLMY